MNLPIRHLSIIHPICWMILYQQAIGMLHHLTAFYIHKVPEQSEFGGGSTGGLDDRFDFILFTGDVNSGANKVQYVNNSCKAFGNDGNHLNDALD